MVNATCFLSSAMRKNGRSVNTHFPVGASKHMRAVEADVVSVCLYVECDELRPAGFQVVLSCHLIFHRVIIKENN